jgi:hypothetical protein
MMASSIYIFDSDRMFKAVYREHVDDLEHKMPLIDLYVKGEKLWVVTNSNDQKERPRLDRSIVHFRKGDAKEWIEGDEKLVTHGKIRFNNKKNHLEIFPRFMRKPLLSMRVGRYFGIKEGKCNIDYDKRYYDFKNDRIIFILDEKE